MNLFLTASILLLSLNGPIKTPDNRGLSLTNKTPIQSTPTSRFIAVSNSSNKDDEEKGNEQNQNQNQNQNGKKDLQLIMIPVSNNWNGEENYSSIPSLNTAYAGELFTVAAFVVDEYGQPVQAQGLFRFTWSSHNYIDPSHPRRSKTPVDTHWNYDVINGRALIRNVNYDECGVIKLTGMVRVRVGNGNKTNVVHGESGNIEFHPHHYDLRISQQAANQGQETSYTYSGQPFSASVTVTALNAKNPPEATENYEGDLALRGNHSLQITLKQPHSPFTSLSYTLSQIAFEQGIARINVAPITLTFTQPQNPQTVAFQYRFSDVNDRTATADTSTMEFRCGRLRIHDRIAIAGSQKRIFIDIHEYRNDRWQLNTQEESLSVSPADLSIHSVVGEETPVITGDSIPLFGGKIRGGENPLGIQSNSFQNDVRFEIDLAENSPLRFLESASGHWILFQQQSFQNRLGYLIDNRVLYEKEIE